MGMYPARLYHRLTNSHYKEAMTDDERKFVERVEYLRPEFDDDTAQLVTIIRSQESRIAELQAQVNCRNFELDVEAAAKSSVEKERDALLERWEKLKDWLPTPDNDIHPDSFVEIVNKMRQLEEPAR